MTSLAIEHQAYDTHLNYIDCLNDLAENVDIQCDLILKKAEIPYAEEKGNLIKLTKRSLVDEYNIVQIDSAYSYASTSWLPIKSYYLLFNLLLTIDYILNLKKGPFRTGHIALVNQFTRKLQSKEIQFSEELLNQVFDRSIFKIKFESGANLSKSTRPEIMYKMLLRKIALYKLDDWKLKNHISLRKKTHKAKCEQYLQTFTISLFDFPYFMRIKSNYREFAFIEGITTAETARYFNAYYNFTFSLVGALERFKKELLAKRT